MQNKLLPCPFCGGEARVWVDGVKEDRTYVVKCMSCGSLGSHRATHSRAKEQWNTRKPMERIVEQLEEHKLIVEIDDDHIVPESDVDEFFELEVVALSDAIEIVKGGVDNG